MPIIVNETNEASPVRCITIISKEHFVLSVRSENEAQKLKLDIKEVTTRVNKESLWNSPHHDLAGTEISITGKGEAALLALITLRAITLRTHRACLRAFSSLSADSKSEDLKTSLSPKSPNFY
jgi:hypothetical protein